uniref:Signal transducer and activator of transcription n=1 Tax=Anopheles melas TaxID=34690 RepID=A0A1E1MX10_9DIPT|nr:TPA_inf: signal transducer and activator of transcription B [Anopheles melas]
METRLNQIPPCILEQFHFLNDLKYPVLIRQHLGNWIKDSLHNAPTYTNNMQSMYELDAAKFFTALVNEVDQVSANLPNKRKCLLCRSAIMLRDQNFQSLTQLYLTLLHQIQPNCEKGCKTEYTIAQTSLNGQQTDVLYGLQQLQVMERNNWKETHQLIQECEHLVQRQDHVQRLSNQRSHNKRIQCYSLKQKSLVDAFQKMIRKAEEVLNLVYNKYIFEWHKTQMFPEVRSTNAYSLDEIQTWYESLAAIMWNTKDQIHLTMKSQLREHVSQEINSDLWKVMKDVKDFIKLLLQKAFIVENQPPQVMKMNTRFCATVRLLIDNALIMKIGNPKVTVSIISEAQAQQFQNTNAAADCSAGEIENNIGSLQYQLSNKFLANFSNMRLKKINRGSRKLNKRVVDEKFALLFQSTFTLEQEELTVTVWTLSLPAVVIVHVNQEQLAWTTIIWDNLCAKADRKLFEVPNLIPWNRLVEAISMTFSARVGRGLTDENMQYMHRKAYRDQLSFSVSNDRMISFAQFCKDTTPECNYTLWEWVYAALKIIRDHLQVLWVDNTIIGFIHKSTAEKYLAECVPGTFLLRFTDSVLGGISIAWVHESNDGQRQVLHIQPFTAKDLVVRSLVNRICDLDELTYLYPNIPKQEAFGQYTAPAIQKPRSKHYIPAEMRTVLIFAPTSNQISSTPNAEQSPSASSNDTFSNEYVLTNLDEIYKFETENVDMMSIQDYWEQQ